MALAFTRRDWIWLSVVLCLLGAIAGQATIFDNSGKVELLRRELKRVKQEAGVDLPADGTWRAFEDHGDKPGTGFDITRTGDDISGFAYIIDPKTPGDFGAEHSVKIPLEILAADAKSIQFKVRWNQELQDQMILELISPLAGKSFVGVLTDLDHPENRQIVLNYVRLPEPANSGISSK